MDVDIRDDNSIVANGNGGNDNDGVVAPENLLGTDDDENVGLDLSESSESEPENGESERDASTDTQSIQRDRRLLSRGMLDTTISIIEMKRSNSDTNPSAASKQQTVEGKTPFQGKRRPSVMKKTDAGVNVRDTSSRSVNFGGVEIHEHERELCESSVPLRGPALGLGWNRVSSQTFQSVDDHLDKTAVAGGPRVLNQLLLPTHQRVDM
jgi:PAB1-binding protein PBP1